MQHAGHSILCAPLSFVGKLERIQLWDSNWQKDLQKQLLQASHCYRCDGNRAVVVVVCGSGFLGQWDYGSSFPEGTLGYGGSPA